MCIPRVHTYCSIVLGSRTCFSIISTWPQEQNNAVYLGLLPMITRRLDAKEREALSSGYCYSWEDRGPHAITGIGIGRFTEGCHWSASRVRDVRIPSLTSV